MALEDAIFLSRLCRKVHLIHRRDELRGARTLQKQVFESDKIEVHWDTVADAIEGDGRVERLALTNRKTGEKTARDILRPGRTELPLFPACSRQGMCGPSSCVRC